MNSMIKPWKIFFVVGLLVTGADIGRSYYMDGEALHEALDTYERVPQMMEEVEAKSGAFSVFSFQNIVDLVRSELVGGETRWDKHKAELDRDFQKIRDALDRYGEAVKYIEGVHDTGEGVFFSCPDAHDTTKMLAIIRNWLKEHPAERALPAAVCVTKALELTWPKKNPSASSGKPEKK